MNRTAFLCSRDDPEYIRSMNGEDRSVLRIYYYELGITPHLQADMAECVLGVSGDTVSWCISPLHYLYNRTMPSPTGADRIF